MQTMVHPNGCVHNVRDDLVDRFKSAGWAIKAAPSEPPEAPEEPEEQEEAEGKPTAPAKPKRGRSRNTK